MYTSGKIHQFLESGPIAIVGVSRNPKKFGFLVYKILQSKGYEVIPINSNATSNGDIPFLKSITELGPEVKKLVVLTPGKETLPLLQQASEKGIDSVWIQKESETPEALEFAVSRQMNVITQTCILMFAQPNGIHKFHRIFHDIFGKHKK